MTHPEKTALTWRQCDFGPAGMRRFASFPQKIDASPSKMPSSASQVNFCLPTPLGPNEPSTTPSSLCSTASFQPYLPTSCTGSAGHIVACWHNLL